MVDWVGMRTSRRLNVSEDDRKGLERLARATKSEQRIVLRARIVLLSGEGVGTGEICERLQTTVPTVTRCVPARWPWRWNVRSHPPANGG